MGTRTIATGFGTMAVAATLTLGGCQPHISSISPFPTKHRNYVVGETRRVALGGSLVDVEDARVLPAYEAVVDYQPPTGDGWRSGFNYPPIRKGMIFAQDAITRDGAIRLRRKGYEGTYFEGTGKKEIHIWITADGRPTDLGNYGLWTREPIFRKAERGYPLPGSSRLELVYTGFEGDTVRLTRKEYQDDYQSPSYVQSLSYALGNARSIEFKGLRIQVVKADPAELEYRVVSDGNLGWLRN